MHSFLIFVETDDLGFGDLGGAGGDGCGAEGGAVGSIGAGQGGVALWEDDDTRAFYECLPELKALVPSILYSESEKAAPPPSAVVSILSLPHSPPLSGGGCFYVF